MTVDYVQYNKVDDILWHLKFTWKFKKNLFENNFLHSIYY